MPHVILEYSQSIIEENTINQFMTSLHSLLEKKLPTELESIKSRIIKHNSFLIGSGEIHKAFVHMEIKILKGRSAIAIQGIGQEIMTLLKSHFVQSISSLNLCVSLEIVELTDYYFKK